MNAYVTWILTSCYDKEIRKQGQHATLELSTFLTTTLTSKIATMLATQYPMS